MATVKAHKAIDTANFPELVQIENGADFATFLFSGPGSDAPDFVKYFHTANPLAITLHGGESDLVIAAAFPASMTVTSIEVTENGDALFEILDCAFELEDAYGNWETMPPIILEGDDRILGSSERDQLAGFAGADFIKGGKGDDDIDGGVGKNELQGNKGDDLFSFSILETSADADHILDFKHGQDSLAFVGPDFDVLDYKANGELRGSMFQLGKTADDADDHLIYNKASGALFFDPDGDGILGKVKVCILDNKPTLSASDIVDVL